MTVAEAAALAGLSLKTVVGRIQHGWDPLRALTTAPADNRWSAWELDLLAKFYRSSTSLNLKRLARLIGRSEGNISRKARQLGLSKKDRLPSYQPSLPFGISRLSPERQHEYLSQIRKQLLARRGHPRGALGMQHSDEFKARISAANKSRWADPGSAYNSEASKQRRSDNMIQRLASGKMNAGFRYSRSNAGKRADLGDVYFRSAWEANYARYLNWIQARGEIVGWQYEPVTFSFHAIKRGTRAYTPDFRVALPDGSHEWHEVKGWMDDKSRIRLERMAEYYPEEKILVIGQDWFKAAGRNGIAHAVAGWERG